MYRACRWNSSKKLDNTALIQTKNAAGEWSILSSLKVKKLTQFVEETPDKIYSLRFETTATATKDRNKGRFCLGNRAFSTSFISSLLPYVDYNYTLRCLIRFSISFLKAKHRKIRH